MIIPLEKQLVCFELSQKMAKLGFKQESLWWWNNQGLGHWHIGYYRPDMSEYSAYTVAELGEIITKYGKHGKELPYWDYGWNCPSFMNTMRSAEAIDSVIENTEADARAKLAIYFKKKGLI